MHRIPVKKFSLETFKARSQILEMREAHSLSLRIATNHKGNVGDSAGDREAKSSFLVKQIQSVRPDPHTHTHT